MLSYCAHHSLSKPTTSFKQRAQLADVLYGQFESGSEFCDVTLVIHGQEQKAHWSVLMSSPYFEALYQSGLSERQSGRIILNFENRTSILAIIKYLYTGTVDITMDNVKSLLRIADYFLLPNFKQSCENYFSSYKSPRLVDDNCVDLCLLGSEFDLPNLYNRASYHIINNFENIVEKPELLTLCNDTIEMLVQTRELTYVKVEKMFEFIVSWTSHDLEGRREFFQDLFCSLDLQNFTKNSFISLVKSCSLVMENSTCKKFIEKFYEQVDLGVLRHMPELSDEREVFVFLGGHSEIKYFSIGRELGFILEKRQWTTYTRMSCINFNLMEPLAVTSSDNSVLVTDSGETQHRILLGEQQNYQTFYKYCPLSEGWSWTTKKLACPAAGFHVECSVACGPATYIIGCVDEDTMPVDWFLYEILWDSPRKNGPVSKLQNGGKIFRTHIPMKTSNSRVQACAVQNRYICVLAGAESKECMPNACFAVYDTKKRKGKKIIYSSTKAVYHPIMFPIGEQLILVKMGIKSATAFNVKKKMFQPCQEFAIPKVLPVSVNRSHYTYKFHYNKLYIFGGILCMRFLTTCFCYRFADNVWDRLPDMPVSLWSGAMCLRQLPKKSTSFNHMHCQRCKTEDQYSFHCNCWDNGDGHGR